MLIDEPELLISRKYKLDKVKLRLKQRRRKVKALKCEYS